MTFQCLNGCAMECTGHGRAGWDRNKVDDAGALP